MKQVICCHASVTHNCGTVTGRVQPLVKCISFSALGPELWKVLLSLDKTYDVSTNAVIITSDVIAKNGFRIEIIEGRIFTFHYNVSDDLKSETCK
jgi:hypothetical protein